MLSKSCILFAILFFVSCSEFRVTNQNSCEVYYVIGNTLRDGGSTWIEYFDKTGKRRGVYMDGFIKEMRKTNKVYIGKYISGYKDDDYHLASCEEVEILVKAFTEYKNKYYPEYRMKSIERLQRQYRKDMKDTDFEFYEFDELTISSAIMAFVEHAKDSCPTSR